MRIYKLLFLFCFLLFPQQFCQPRKIFPFLIYFFPFSFYYLSILSSIILPLNPPLFFFLFSLIFSISFLLIFLKYNKLVRDKIPKIINNDGKKAVTHKADKKEYYRKLKEEVDEFFISDEEEELA